MTSLLSRSLTFAMLALVFGSTSAAQPLVPAGSLKTVGLGYGNWPADFNGDGITDLVGSGSSGVRVLLGNGDGTFRPPIDSSGGQPIAVGDLNGDGRTDVITGTSTGGALAILPGNGDGTFGAPVRAFSSASPAFVIVTDLNNDGRRDIAWADAGEESHALHILPGNGDFTFAPVIDVETEFYPVEAIAVDVNGDGLKDIPMVHRMKGAHHGRAWQRRRNLWPPVPVRRGSRRQPDRRRRFHA